MRDDATDARTEVCPLRRERDENVFRGALFKAVLDATVRRLLDAAFLDAAALDAAVRRSVALCDAPVFDAAPFNAADEEALGCVGVD